MADILTSADFQKISGKTLNANETARYSEALASAVGALELQLGWPLDPSTWDDMYIEIGKSRNDCNCPGADTETDAPDEFEEDDEKTYRLFSHNPRDEWMRIDPALEIQSIKIVRNGYTCKTLDLAKHTQRRENGDPTWIQWVYIGDPCGCYNNWSWCGCKSNDPAPDNQSYDIAVRAEWAFDPLPDVLKKVLADYIRDEFDLKKDVRSESVVSHSYTKADRIELSQLHASVLKRYAGPNGLARRPRSVL